MQKYNHYTKSSTEIAQCFKFVKTKEQTMKGFDQNTSLEDTTQQKPVTLLPSHSLRHMLVSKEN